jgi:hypothetical protein
MLQRIWRVEGPARLFSGLLPRVLWIGLGGFVFFGSFEAARALVNQRVFPDRSEQQERERTYKFEPPAFLSQQQRQ